MCETCGCVVAGSQSGHAAHDPHHHHDHHHAHHQETGAAITVMRGLMAGNDHQAAHNRAHFAEHRVLAVNLMSSPGAGKTALLEATIAAIGDRMRIAVIEGDLETENDAERIRARGVPAVQITTGTACHLDAFMVHDALHGLDLDGLDIVFIENVGNLVCPAAFDLGQHANVALLSVTEGDDKPAKYPVMFRGADLVLLSKADLLAHFDDFDPAKAERYVRALANRAPVERVSVRTEGGLAPWIDWLRASLAEVQAHGAAPAAHPHADAVAGAGR